MCWWAKAENVNNVDFVEAAKLLERIAESDVQSDDEGTLRCILMA
jgi:hypothetical protein